jgi:hypothetical protein
MFSFLFLVSTTNYFVRRLEAQEVRFQELHTFVNDELEGVRKQLTEQAAAAGAGRNGPEGGDDKAAEQATKKKEEEWRRGVDRAVAELAQRVQSIEAKLDRASAARTSAPPFSFAGPFGADIDSILRMAMHGGGGGGGGDGGHSIGPDGAQEDMRVELVADEEDASIEPKRVPESSKEPSPAGDDDEGDADDDDDVVLAEEVAALR